MLSATRKQPGWAPLLTTMVLAGALAGGAEPEWQSLFDGASLDGWKVTDFGGAPEEVHVTEGNSCGDGAAPASASRATVLYPRSTTRSS